MAATSNLFFWRLAPKYVLSQLDPKLSRMAQGHDSTQVLQCLKVHGYPESNWVRHMLHICHTDVLTPGTSSPYVEISFS